MRVPGHQGIEGPENLGHSQLRHQRALVQLEPAADAVVPRFSAHREHVRPVYQLAVPNAGHPEDETQDPRVGCRAVEGRCGDAAEVLRHLENGGGNPLAETGAPGLVLDPDTLFVFSLSLHPANHDCITGHGGASVVPRAGPGCPASLPRRHIRYAGEPSTSTPSPIAARPGCATMVLSTMAAADATKRIGVTG